MSGEPTQAEISSYHGPIAMPAPPAPGTPYPNLADVPPRPTPMLTPAQRAEEVARLKKENAEGQQAINDYVSGAAK
jgi:hypothetical protein